MDSLASLARYATVSPAPICASETLGSRAAFRDLLETGAAGIVMLDIAWCGGISEAKKISDLADSYYIPTAPHTCGGPLLWFSSIQCVECKENPTGLTPKCGLISAEAIECEIR